ncbi:hypothetical protein WKK05_37645 (plasmid) [Nostoc sp. UHCC 0302]|uniref:hypothetical protein n=1 Tax=Nostoc sp. UHCC 0302 TaxID=3134896 RepID=UPI00311C9703
MSSIVNGLVQNKILLAILAGVTAIGSFQVWKYNQEKHEKFIAEQTAKCQKQLDLANTYIDSSKTLYVFYNYPSSPLNEVERIEKPGINKPFKIGETYVLIYKVPGRLVPDNPRYDGKFFEGLSKQTTEGVISPLAVTARAIQGKQATVSTFCSPQTFTVSVENLYDPNQQNDVGFPSTMFFP